MLARQTASSIAMHAPWAKYCSVGCAASPSRATRPSTHRSTGSRSHHPELPVLAVADDLLSARMNVLESFQHFLVAHRLASDRLCRLIVIGDDQIKHLPAGQRVMDDVALWSGPKGRSIPAQIFGHLLGRDHRTIGRVP